MSEIKNVYASQISVGDELPVFVLDLTPRVIVSCAIASQDFQDVHHDKAAAIPTCVPNSYLTIFLLC